MSAQQRQVMEVVWGQQKILDALAKRLASGDEPLPADVMAKLAEELEQRIDEEAVREAWVEQGKEAGAPWRGESARANRRARGRDVREILALERALTDLAQIDEPEREELAVEIDALAFDASPRGALGMHHHRSDHQVLRVGAYRLIYCVRGNSVIVVCVTKNP